MSEPIQETSEKKSSRQKGMEAWAAAMQTLLTSAEFRYIE